MWAFFYFQLLYFWYRRRRYSSNRLRLETTTRLRIFLWHHDPDVFIIGLDAAFWRPQCLNVGHNYLWTPYTWCLRSCARCSWFYQARQAYTSQWSWGSMEHDTGPRGIDRKWVNPALGVLICKEKYARRLVGYLYDGFCRTVVGSRENEELPMRKGDCERQSDSEDSASKRNVSLNGRLYNWCAQYIRSASY